MLTRRFLEKCFKWRKKMEERSRMLEREERQWEKVVCRGQDLC